MALLSSSLFRMCILNFSLLFEGSDRILDSYYIIVVTCMHLVLASSMRLVCLVLFFMGSCSVTERMV